MKQETKQKPRYNRQRSSPVTIRQCNKCNSTDIKSRTNYSHGKKSKSRTSFTCNKCNSGDIKVTKPRGRY